MKLRCIVFVLLLAAWPAAAQNFPTKPITLINGFQTGGPTDIQLRKLAEIASRTFGQPVILESKPGAGGMLGSVSMARSAKPDGYTVAQLSASAFRIPHMEAVDWNPLKDFTYIIGLTGYEFGVLVKADSPIKTFMDFIKYAKANPERLSYASVGAGTATHVLMEEMALKAGIKLLHVPYKGNAPAVTAVVAGEVPIGVLATTAVLPLLKAGRIKALAVSGLKRSALAPEVPTIAESGYADFSAEFGILLAVPARTADDVVSALYREVARVLQEVEVRNTLRNMGMEVTALNPEDTRRRVDAETRRWSAVISSAGIRQD